MPFSCNLSFQVRLAYEWWTKSFNPTWFKLPGATIGFSILLNWIFKPSLYRNLYFLYTLQFLCTIALIYFWCILCRLTVVDEKRRRGASERLIVIVKLDLFSRGSWCNCCGLAASIYFANLCLLNLYGDKGPLLDQLILSAFCKISTTWIFNRNCISHWFMHKIVSATLY